MSSLQERWVTPKNRSEVTSQTTWGEVAQAYETDPGIFEPLTLLLEHFGHNRDSSIAEEHIAEIENGAVRMSQFAQIEVGRLRAILNVVRMLMLPNAQSR